jgi:MFS family permease
MSTGLPKSDSAQTTLQQPGSSPAQLLILTGSFFFLFLGTGALQQFILPILGTQIGLQDTHAAGVLAAVYLAGPLFLGVYGHVYRLLRERWCLVLGGLMYTLFPAGVLLASRYATPQGGLWSTAGLIVLAFGILWGFGAEIIWATGPTQVINTSPSSRYGSLSGIFQSGTYGGQMAGVLMLGTVLAASADPASGQRALLVTAVGISLVGNVLALGLRTHERTQPPARLGDALLCLRSLAGRYLVMLSVASYLGWGLVLSALTGLIQDIGAQQKLHLIVLPFYAGRLVSAWLAGRISDAVGRERVMLTGFLLGTVGLAFTGLAPSPATIAVVSAVLGMQAAMVGVASTAAVGDYIASSERHLVFAGTNAWGYLAAGLTILGSQWLRQHGGTVAPPLEVFAVFYGACAVLVESMRRRLARR